MITTYLSVALLIALVFWVRRPFAKAFGAKAAYALWALPLARLLMPPVPSWMSPMSWLTARSPSETSEIAEVTAGLPPVPTVKPDLVTTGAMPAPAPVPSPDAAPEMVAMAAPAVETAGGAFALPSFDQALLVLITIVTVGAAGLVARQLHSQWQFHSLIRGDSETPSDALEQMSATVQAAVGLKRRVPVRASFLCGAPLVTGVLRPVILVPAWFELDYTKEEQRIALTHEAMHVKRGDLFALQLAHMVAAIQWLNPLAWRALDAFRADQEAACDADVLALKTTSPRSYGATLLKAIRLSRPGSAPAFAAALPLNHSIKDRFAMLQTEGPTPPNKRMAMVLSLGVGAAALLATATAQEAELKGGEEAESTSVTRVIIRSHGEGRELVMLTNPMAELDEHLAQLDALDWPEPPTPPTPPVPPRPPVMDLSFLSDLETLSELESLEALGDIVTLAVDGSSLSIHGGEAVIISKDGEKFAFSLSEDDIQAMAERIEEHAEAFEARMEEWAEQFEANFEVSFEADMDAFEAEIERMELRVEEITESEEFDALVERSTRSIEELHEECDDEDMAGVDMSIIVSEAGDKAICIDEDADRAAVEAAIMADPNLTEAEKQKFLNSRGQNVHVHIHRSGGEHTYSYSHGHDDHK